MHQHLWWAGRPYNIRALHQQKVCNRGIVINEKPWLHLLWYEQIIFIKPLPAYLLSVPFFDEHIEPDEDLRALALGFLRSYAKLIQSPIDLKIAHDENLVPENLEWEVWARLAPHFTYLEDSKVNKRYKYGELRLPRVNQAHRFCIDFPNGYYSQYVTYKQFFNQNFAWLLLAVVYVSVVLTALQLLLSTDENTVPLERPSLEKSSWWFAMMSMVVLCATCGLMVILVIGSFTYHCICTVQNLQRLNMDWVGGRRRIADPEKPVGLGS
ncbi:hypothetical protein BZA05DRAFT_395609 [Tricharina praecox]|uniref:uncharacterized protein n=1 Tax=Tricharina praecox TaxID=43433 RepID=UPI00221E3CD8|nr:uncharacterized protein BZA05DRAFT_395609 [Tricharina praecox]KAI5853311.1 hypothetical protein BZA05DRAFT_395609 [Tricharina praecox]